MFSLLPNTQRAPHSLASDGVSRADSLQKLSRRGNPSPFDLKSLYSCPSISLRRGWMHSGCRQRSSIAYVAVSTSVSLKYGFNNGKAEYHGELMYRTKPHRHNLPNHSSDGPWGLLWRCVDKPLHTIHLRYLSAFPDTLEGVTYWSI